VATLTGHDFDSVLASNARVFVNFYSPGEEGREGSRRRKARGWPSNVEAETKLALPASNLT